MRVLPSQSLDLKINASSFFDFALPTSTNIYAYVLTEVSTALKQKGYFAGLWCASVRFEKPVELGKMTTTILALFAQIVTVVVLFNDKELDCI